MLICRCLTCLGLLVGFSYSCTVSQGSQSEKEEMEMVVTTDSGLQYQIMKEGVGKGAQVGEEVLIFETTMYRDDTVLYSNEDTDQPIKVKLGAGQVLAGIEEGLQGMREGEVRKMMIPAELARRKFYPDHISPDSALVVKMILFDILK